MIPNPITVPLTIAESVQQVALTVAADIESIALGLPTSLPGSTSTRRQA